MNQVQLEERMLGLGVQRAMSMMTEAEVSGNAHRNPYAHHVYKTYIVPVHEYIQHTLDNPNGSGRMRAHATLLKDLDSMAVAYITIREVLSVLLSDSRHAPTVRRLGATIGRVVNSELYLSSFKGLAPDLYYILDKDLHRRRSTNVQHRINVFKDQARKNGMELYEWPVGARDQVGLWLIDVLINLGFVTMDEPPKGPGRRRDLLVHFSDKTRADITYITEFFKDIKPMVGPCIERPIDWTSVSDGGFHTEAMRRVHPYCVRAPQEPLEALHGDNVAPLLRTLNLLQKTCWRINTEVLDIVRSISSDTTTGEIISDLPGGPPAPPDWLDDIEDMSPTQEAAFRAWKVEAAVWYQARNLHLSKRRAFLSAIRSAEFYREFPELYYVWFADSRGRMYPVASDISPQGSDLQRGVLHFARGVSIADPVARDWFYINGANKFGYDKHSIEKRSVWHIANERMILDVAEDPINNRSWLNADKPIQFLSWCLEYKRYRDNPDEFLTHLPVAIDGSCNGLQHLSALLRDNVGATATNLRDLSERQDIYTEVAGKTLARLKSDPSPIAKAWVDLGVDRATVKRPVMTTPYGVMQRTVTEYILHDVLIATTPEQFDSKEYYVAADVLSKHLWESIDDVVVAARVAMPWLTNLCREVMVKRKSPPSFFSWTTPDGFLATQQHFASTRHRITTYLYGHQKVLVLSESPDAKHEARRYLRAIAPDFVHSLDATHLRMTMDMFTEMYPDAEDFSMIHDEFGVPADKAQDLYMLTRHAFHDLYKNNNPLANLAREHDIDIDLPTMGTYDISEVLSSEFFFS